MHGNQDLVTFTEDANGDVVVCIALISGRGELHVDVLGDARWHHPFLVVADFEVGCLGRQDMESLRCRRIVDQSHFQSVRFSSLKPCKFDYCRARLEYLV